MMPIIHHGPSLLSLLEKKRGNDLIKMIVIMNHQVDLTAANCIFVKEIHKGQSIYYLIKIWGPGRPLPPSIIL